MEAKIITATVHFPFWLNWAKKFMRIEMKTIILPSNIQGRSCDTIIIDEATACQKL